jgi:hypothetical protein
MADFLQPQTISQSMVFNISSKSDEDAAAPAILPPSPDVTTACASWVVPSLPYSTGVALRRVRVRALQEEGSADVDFRLLKGGATVALRDEIVDSTEVSLAPESGKEIHEPGDILDIVIANGGTFNDTNNFKYFVVSLDVDWLGRGPLRA